MNPPLYEASRPSPQEELLRTLYAQVPIIIIGNLALVIANIYAYRDKLALVGLVAWGGATAIMLALRLSMLVHFKKRGFSVFPADRHGLFLQWFSFCNGIVWGLWGWFVAASVAPSEIAVMVVLQAGICAGTVSTSSASRMGLALFVVPALTPLTLYLLLQQDAESVTLALSFMVYTVLVIGAAQRIFATINSSIRLAEDNRRLAAKLYKSSNTDGLTGIANRRAFDRYFHHLAEESARDGEVFSLMLIDVDYFKAFNDHQGHLAGDDCLKLLADEMERYFTASGYWVARYGGEEFVVMLPATSSELACQMAEAFRERIESLAIAHPGSPDRSILTISTGVASSQPDEVCDQAALVQLADQALYAAKADGRNRVVCFEKALTTA